MKSHDYTKQMVLPISQKRVEQEDVRLHAVNIPVLSVHVLNSILLTNTGIWITRNKENKMRTHSRSTLYYILKEAGDREGARHDICTTLRHNVGNQIVGKWQHTGSTAHNITNQSDEIKCQ